MECTYLTYYINSLIIIPTMHGPNNFAFIDGANLHFTYESTEIDWKLDYQKLRNYLKKKLGVTVAYYFIGEIQIYKDIYTNLESYDYTLKLKSPSVNRAKEQSCPYCKKIIEPERKINKADCDSFLTLTAISYLHLYDKAVLITSDGDYDELVKMLLRQNRLHMVFAPCKEGCSWLLKSAARGRIAFIDDFRDELEKT